MSRRFALGVMVAGLLATGNAWADEPELTPLKPPVQTLAPAPAQAPPPAVPGSLEAVMRAQPRCTSFTNGCEICQRTEAGSQCSTPGPVCQPAEWRCETAR